MVPRRWKLRRFGVHAGSFLLGTILSGILGTVILGLSIREFGLLVTAMALTIIFFFEVLYQHNVRIGRIPEDRAEALRVLMLPMVYLAAVGLLFPFLDAPGFDSTARFAIILAFPALTLCAIGWAFVRERRRRARREQTLPDMGRNMMRWAGLLTGGFRPSANSSIQSGPYIIEGSGRAQDSGSRKQAKPPIWPLLGSIGLTVFVAVSIAVGTAIGSPAPWLAWFALLFVGFLLGICAWAYFHLRKGTA